MWFYLHMQHPSKKTWDHSDFTGALFPLALDLPLALAFVLGFALDRAGADEAASAVEAAEDAFIVLRLEGKGWVCGINSWASAVESIQYIDHEF